MTLGLLLESIRKLSCLPGSQFCIFRSIVLSGKSSKESTAIIILKGGGGEQNLQTAKNVLSTTVGCCFGGISVQGYAGKQDLGGRDWGVEPALIVLFASCGVNTPIWQISSYRCEGAKHM